MVRERTGLQKSESRGAVTKGAGVAGLGDYHPDRSEREALSTLLRISLAVLLVAGIVLLVTYWLNASM
ncbi:MAG: hypothetical protein Q7Q71_07935 [Verrucomicrobiota bacterium JB023]|nr:hypothetical protein [Verrucomicrobiota bacterium JB023]